MLSQVISLCSFLATMCSLTNSLGPLPYGQNIIYSQLPLDFQVAKYDRSMDNVVRNE